jgi:shikimate kinase
MWCDGDKMTQPKRIFIVGHTGAGKSVHAEALAKQLGWQYIDANPGLERYIGRNIDEIVGDAGAAAFHACEAEIILHYLTKENVVVVLEENAIATEQNRKLLSSECVVYLTVSISAQIAHWEEGRVPLLPIADLKAFLEKQHVERDSLYESVATITIPSIDSEADVNKIILLIKQM